MLHNFIFRDASEALPKLLRELEGAPEVTSRAGLTKELMHVGITLTQPLHRELLVQDRKPSIAAQIAETAWVLAGRGDIGFLSQYLPRATDFSDDGETWRGAYGTRLRWWAAPQEKVVNGVSVFGYHNVDQLRYVYETLKKSPISRQAVAVLFDPAIDEQPGKDIPCNNWLSFSSRLGYLDLHVALRSNDAFWGWSGINQFEWSVLLEVMANLLGLEVGALHFSVTSFHLYGQHWNRASKIADNVVLDTQAFDSPAFQLPIAVDKIAELDRLLIEWFSLEEDIRGGFSMAKEVDSFPEPMLRSWLRVLQWWWSGDAKFLAPLEGTRLWQATKFSVQPKVEVVVDERPEPTPMNPRLSPFLHHVLALHESKHAAYGDSWKRRGEPGILNNIARKVDRLGKAETADETSADTALDLMVYLAKYTVWLGEEGRGVRDYPAGASDRVDEVHQLLIDVEEVNTVMLADDAYSPQAEMDLLRGRFERIEQAVVDHKSRSFMVLLMLNRSYPLARTLWESENEYKGADHE